METMLSLMPNLKGLMAGVIDQEDAAAPYEQIDRRPQDILRIVRDYSAGLRSDVSGSESQ